MSSKPKKNQDETEKELVAELESINEEESNKKQIYITTYDKNGKGKQEKYTSPTEEETNPTVKHSPSYIA